MTPRKFSVLDGMRGIAALLVVTRHTHPAYWGGLSFHHSYLAVDLFFILSGFVISHAYAQKLADGRLDGRRFMRVRWIRLYPLFFLASLLGFAAAVTGAMSNAGLGTLTSSLLLLLLFLPSRLPASQELFPLNGPSWSLFFEMLANLFYALSHRWLSTPRLVAAVACSGVGMLAIVIFNGGTDIGFSWGLRSFCAGLLKSTFGIFLGVLLHRIYQKNAGRHVSMGPWLPMVIMTAVLLLPSLGRYDVVVDVLAVLLVFPLCVYAGACAHCRPATARGFDLLGVLSYPIYLLHLPVGRLLDMTGLPTVPMAGLLLALVLVGLCLAIDAWYDQPVRRYLTARWLKTARATPPQGATSEGRA